MYCSLRAFKLAPTTLHVASGNVPSSRWNEQGWTCKRQLVDGNIYCFRTCICLLTYGAISNVTVSHAMSSTTTPGSNVEGPFPLHHSKHDEISKHWNVDSSDQSTLFHFHSGPERLGVHLDVVDIWLALTLSLALLDAATNSVYWQVLHVVMSFTDCQFLVQGLVTSWQSEAFNVAFYPFLFMYKYFSRSSETFLAVNGEIPKCLAIKL